MNYFSMSREELAATYQSLKAEYEVFLGRSLSLDLSRGKPCTEQLAFSDEMLGVLAKAEDCVSEAGFDCRNYGQPYGLPEAQRLFSCYTGVPADRIIVGGNSSLNLMYDALTRCMLYGTAGSPRPWCREPKLKFLCPCPGYDRHFAVTESLGFELVPVKMTSEGPDMDEVEALVADPAVKGIWCVPQYANPTGVTYSEETVRRLAAMKTAAPDFRIFWDNAYAVHAFVGEVAPLADIFAEAERAGNPERVFYFTSPSKITYPGAGIAMVAAGPESLAMIKSVMAVQTIGHDKLNQLRHVRLFADRAAFDGQMKKQASVIARKFEILFAALHAGLDGTGTAVWTEPKGGYFSSLDVADGCATRVYELCQTAGVVLTKVGATFPYGKDPDDRNLRLAPTFAKDEDLKTAVSVLCCAVKLAVAEKLLAC